MTKVKVCGITNRNDALEAVRAGCKALGFIFYRKSPRYVSPARARQICRQVPAQTLKVGVFVNARRATVERVARLCGLDCVQLHGNESPAFCSAIKGPRVIKAFRVKEERDLSKVARYRVWAYLFDTLAKGSYGGTGKSFDWKLLKGFKSPARTVFLSGGLDAGNVRRAIRTAHPDWVDVSSSVEESPGRKDREKIRRFIAAVK